MNCTQCGQVIQRATRFCPGCGAAVAAVAAAAVGGAVSSAVGGPAPTKACPFCGEQIMQAAVRCRFCSSDLTAQPGSHGGIVVQGPGSALTGVPSIVIQNVQSSQPAHSQYIPHEVKNPGVAMLLSIVFPGGGQFYNGHAGKGILILCTCWLVIPWIWGIFDAYSCAKRINRVGF